MNGKGLWTVASALVAAVSLGATRTPTPLPRLSGGFGRPRSTPNPAVSGGGQSLADVVRAAREARDQSQSPEREKSGLTINNRSLVTNPEKGRVSTSKITPPKPTPAPTASPRVRTGEVGAPAPPASSEAPGATEEEWRSAAHRARTRVQEARAQVEELDAVVHKLENDFYAWDDGQYRDRVIKPSWDRSRGQLEEARHELSAAEKDLADLPEKARRAGALPGWIRE